MPEGAGPREAEAQNHTALLLASRAHTCPVLVCKRSQARLNASASRPLPATEPMQDPRARHGMVNLPQEQGAASGAASGHAHAVHKQPGLHKRLCGRGPANLPRKSFRSAVPRDLPINRAEAGPQPGRLAVSSHREGALASGGQRRRAVQPRADLARLHVRWTSQLAYGG